ncbi:hypothetical protein ACFS27_20025 [Promicromonospora vindobonensis]|uniref:Uncharacterized protein n=1 Tax=Promicromonospora vindobonensis TaxID=195748 RepID=A0ABW5VZ45_9MICO
METSVQVPTGGDTTALLRGLLEGAAAAHGIHERENLGGVYDEAWPEWYAEHMAHALARQGYRIVPVGGTAADGPGEAGHGHP